MKKQREIRPTRRVAALAFVRPLLPIGVAVFVLLPQAALAATVPVSVQNFAFSPQTANVARGDFVKWTFEDAVPHTATDTTGMKLFNSGSKSGGATYTTPNAFVGAGIYRYRCEIHTSMTGKVSVPMKASPTSGGVSTSFAITWASSSRTGFNFDVQVKRPGSASFSDWKVNQTALSSSFKADKGKGKYQFRARFQKGTGAASAYSSPISITVS